jgi:SAM-dependent methyltransferase
MELRMYQRMWHGIDLTMLPAAADAIHKPASAEFYAQFYQALEAGRGRIDPQWLGSKRHLGEAIERGLILPWKEKHHRSPSILALAAGKAFAERVWAEHGFDVVFNDCQEESLAEVRRDFPKAAFLVGDVRDLKPSTRYDLITALTLDYVMARNELVEFLATISGWLAPGGQIILYCASTLSLRQIAVEAAKHLLGRYRRRPHVFWGYWRTPGEFGIVARRAGLRMRSSQQFAGRVREQPLKDRGIFSCLPPWRDSNLVVTLEQEH